MPLTPLGAKGRRFCLLKSTKPPMVMNPTRSSLSTVKVLTVILLRFTPRSITSTHSVSITPAYTLMVPPRGSHRL
jgi:hypothetical protein